LHWKSVTPSNITENVFKQFPSTSFTFHAINCDNGKQEPLSIIENMRLQNVDMFSENHW